MKADQHQARLISYVFIFFAYYGFATLAMYTFGNSFMSIFAEWIGCSGASIDACYGASIVFRTAASLLIFYFLIFLLMLPKDDFSYSVNKNFWPVKWLFPGLLFIGACFLDNGIFEGIAKAGKYLGIIYLLIQDFSYNEFFFRWSNSWIKKKKSNVCYAVLYYVFLLGSLAAMILLLILNFKWHWKDGCGANKFWLLVNIFIIVINYALTGVNMTCPKRLRDDVNFVGTTLFSLYTTYYFYSGISSDTKGGCSAVLTSTTFLATEIIISSILILVVFVFLSYSKSLPFIPQEEETETEGNVVTREVRLRNRVRENGEDAGEAYDQIEYRTMKYVWIFAGYVFLVLYFQNVVTNWGTVTAFSEIYSYDSDQAGYYIKIFNACFNSLLYIYVLIAPIILPGRKFGSEANQN
jgi:hypothetical protein